MADPVECVSGIGGIFNVDTTYSNYWYPRQSITDRLLGTDPTRTGVSQRRNTGRIWDTPGIGQGLGTLSTGWGRFCSRKEGTSIDCRWYVSSSLYVYICMETVQNVGSGTIIYRHTRIRHCNDSHFSLCLLFLVRERTHH